VSWTVDQVRSRLGASTDLFFWDQVRLGREQIFRLFEAGKLPLWWACGALSEFLGPPEVGAEAIIKNAIASLWDQ